MNPVHLHLMIVHLPMFLVPLGALLLIIGMTKHLDLLKRTALAIFAAASLTAVGAFFLGDAAEDKVEDLPGISEHQIHEHEEAAEAALWLSIALGALSLGALAPTKFNILKNRGTSSVILLLALINTASLVVTAQEGGKIRHPEAFGGNQVQSGAQTQAETQPEADED